MSLYLITGKMIMKSIYLVLEELWTNRHNDASCESGKVFCSGFKSLRIQDFLKLP
jgi:hypothetical protein